ncbi:hypothetical protein EV421DRAFT_1739466 [Armillaria borealis]|uniref:Uncharacterized protein n=1 Tax=Armillaria borealis TaxID=47425 RepID=A0AA39MJN5_9AGAR|nr:hypothetical protein EV421DRAFT_1739466 [Armillaria borealis]
MSRSSYNRLADRYQEESLKCRIYHPIGRLSTFLFDQHRLVSPRRAAGRPSPRDWSVRLEMLEIAPCAWFGAEGNSGIGKSMIVKITSTPEFQVKARVNVENYLDGASADIVHRGQSRQAPANLVYERNLNTDVDKLVSVTEFGMARDQATSGQQR